MTRRYLPVVALLAVFVLAGCLGGNGLSDSQLNQNESYEWNTSASATIRLGGDSYTSIYRINGSSGLNVYQRDVFNNREPLEVRALRFRYPNGTVVSPENSTLDAGSNGDRTRLKLPNETGWVAFTADQEGKNFRTPTFVGGDYDVVLPPDTGVGIPILSHVVPGGYETEEIDGRVHVTWSNVNDDTVIVEYYLNRDLLLFGGMFGILFVVAVGGGIYYWRQIRALEQRREEVGLDVEDDEDDPRDKGPPPGMG